MRAPTLPVCLLAAFLAVCLLQGCAPSGEEARPGAALALGPPGTAPREPRSDQDKLVEPAPASPSTTANAQDSRRTPGGAASTTIAALERRLRKGMAYADFRKAVLDAGWSPVVTPDCRVHLLGANADAICAGDEPLASCTVCTELPELEACSSDAFCLMRFRHAGQRRSLTATASGEIEYWADGGPDPGLQIVRWDLTPSE